METIQTKGEISYINGFSLQKEIRELLNKEKLTYKITKFYISSPYQKRRYKPEFVGQEVWIKTPYSESVCITQEDYEYCEKINDFEPIILRLK